MTGERITRGQMSRIDQLPEDIRERINELLRSGVTQVDILKRLERPLRDIGERPLSAAGLSRYAARMERVGRRIREYRAISKMWQDQFGKAGSEVGMQIIEMLRTVAWDLAERAMEESEAPGAEPTLTPEDLKDLALGVARLERAAEIGTKRARAMREEIAAEAAEAAAKSAEKAARESGHALPVEVLERIRRDVYGIRDAA